VIGFGHRPTAITILGRATPVLDLWRVGPLLLMPRRPPFPESLGELAPGLLSKLSPRQFHFDLAERTNLGLDGGQPCVAERRILGGDSAGLLGQIEIRDTPFVSLGP
jgi:hypothetical protein